MNKVYHEWKTSFNKEVGLWYFYKLKGVEKGIYGMMDSETDKIIYVGEGIDISYRVWQHYHDFRFGGKLNLFHNSFYRHMRPDLYRPITQADAKPIIQEMHARYYPVLLWEQIGDDWEANGNRLLKELYFMNKYKETIINTDRPDIRVKNNQNKYTNDLGRYE